MANYDFSGGPTWLQWIAELKNLVNQLIVRVNNVSTDISNVRQLPAGGTHGQVATPAVGGGYEWVNQSGGSTITYEEVAGPITVNGEPITTLHVYQGTGSEAAKRLFKFKGHYKISKDGCTLVIPISPIQGAGAYTRVTWSGGAVLYYWNNYMPEQIRYEFPSYGSGVVSEDGASITQTYSASHYWTTDGYFTFTDNVVQYALTPEVVPDPPATTPPATT